MFYIKYIFKFILHVTLGYLAFFLINNIAISFIEIIFWRKYKIYYFCVLCESGLFDYQVNKFLFMALFLSKTSVIYLFLKKYKLFFFYLLIDIIFPVICLLDYYFGTILMFFYCSNSPIFGTLSFISNQYLLSFLYSGFLIILVFKNKERIPKL